jgi:hypothetical protein
MSYGIHWRSHPNQPEEAVMTSISTTRTARQEGLLPIALGTAAGAAALNALGIFGDGTEGSTHDAGEFWVITGVIVVSVGLVFGVVVRHWQGTRRAGAAGLVLAALALLLTVPAFWSGLPVVLGAGALTLGLADRRGPGTRAGPAAISLGALAVLAYVAIYILDWMSTNDILGM